jgi:hypothetical protein
LGSGALVCGLGTGGHVSGSTGTDEKVGLGGWVGVVLGRSTFGVSGLAGVVGRSTRTVVGVAFGLDGVGEGGLQTLFLRPSVDKRLLKLARALPELGRELKAVGPVEQGGRLLLLGHGFGTELEDFEVVGLEEFEELGPYGLGELVQR